MGRVSWLLLTAAIVVSTQRKGDNWGDTLPEWYPFDPIGRASI